MGSSKKAAVILSGCGVYDGSEVTEAVSILISLSRAGYTTRCYAPNVDQCHAVDHTTGTPHEATRNARQEAARITRGDVGDLAELTAGDYDFLVVAGGFGVAKNLCDFAFKGKDLTLVTSYEAALKSFHSASKPIVCCCISPITAAKAFPGCTITLGKTEPKEAWQHAGSIEAAVALGAKHQDCDVTETCIDEKNKILSTPAYMKTAGAHEVADGIDATIKAAIALL